MRKLKWSVLSILILLSLQVQAALNDLGNGLVNDTTQNITWLRDANMVKTLCDANDPLWAAWPEPNPAVANNSGRTKAIICTVGNGQLNWYEAEAWVAYLNANNYLGYVDWRQPAVGQPDASCTDVDGNGQNWGYRCTGSELGHLWNMAVPDGLDNPNHLDDACGPNCLVNTAPFQNMQILAYWSGTEYAPIPINAWFFNTTFSYQNHFGKGGVTYLVWPVRSGQSVVAASPQPVPMLGQWGMLLICLALLGLVWRRIRLFG